MVSTVAQGEPSRGAHMEPAWRRDQTPFIDVGCVPPGFSWRSGRGGLYHHALDDGPEEALPVREGERGEGRDDVGGEARHTPMEVVLLERHDLLAADRIETRLHVRPPLA